MFCCTPGAENQEGADFGGMEVERIPVRIACAMGITIVAAVVAAVSRLTLLTLRLMKCALCSAANSLGTPKPPAQAQAPTQHDTSPHTLFSRHFPLSVPRNWHNWICLHFTFLEFPRLFFICVQLVLNFPGYGREKSCHRLGNWENWKRDAWLGGGDWGLKYKRVWQLIVNYNDNWSGMKNTAEAG